MRTGYAFPASLDDGPEVEERREEQKYVGDYVRAYLLGQEQVVGPQQQQAVRAHREGREHREDVEDGGGAVLFAGDEQHRDPEQDHEPQEHEVELAEPEALCRTDEVVRHVRLAAGEGVEDTEGHLPADDGYEDKEHAAHERPAR